MTKTLIVWLIGCVMGFLGALALLFFNPFATQIKARPITEVSESGYLVESFYLDAPKHAIAGTHDGNKPIDAFPPGISLFTEDNIKSGFALLSKIRNADGTVIGFASELEVVSPESNILLGKMITDTDWTVVIPGRGTLFLSQIEDNSEFAKKVVVPALTLGKEWNEPWTFISSAGPRPDGRGIILGGTGEFEGIEGAFLEISHLKRFTKDKELFLTVELKLEYRINK